MECVCVDFFMSFGTVLSYLRDFCAKGGAATSAKFGLGSEFGDFWCD